LNPGNEPGRLTLIHRLGAESKPEPGYWDDPRRRREDVDKSGHSANGSRPRYSATVRSIPGA